MRVLLVSSRHPLPPWRGNQLRTVQWLDALTDHRCLLLCPPPDGRGAAGDLRGEIRLLPSVGVTSLVRAVASAVSSRPAQEILYGSRRARRAVAAAVRDWQPDVAVIQMVRCAWAADAVAEVAPDVPLLFDAIDSMALHFSRAADDAPFGLGLASRIEAAKCRRRENELVRRVALTTAVCSRDLDALCGRETGCVVTVAAEATGVPVGRSAREPVVMLSGNLGYRPTVRAARWFADRVWPRVRQTVPGATWVLAGARPAPEMRRIAERPGVELHGDVDDVTPYLGRARLAIAPMASGSGVPLKILEALAAGVSVLADPWSAAGLEDPTAVVAVEGEESWVDAAVELLTDDGAAARRRDHGLEVWAAHYHPDRVRERILSAVEAVWATAER